MLTLEGGITWLPQEEGTPYWQNIMSAATHQLQALAGFGKFTEFCFPQQFGAFSVFKPPVNNMMHQL